MFYNIKIPPCRDVRHRQGGLNLSSGLHDPQGRVGYHLRKCCWLLFFIGAVLRFGL